LRIFRAGIFARSVKNFGIASRRLNHFLFITNASDRATLGNQICGKGQAGLNDIAFGQLIRNAHSYCGRSRNRIARKHKVQGFFRAD
jgi:hypothetical protein